MEELGGWSLGVEKQNGIGTINEKWEITVDEYR